MLTRYPGILPSGATLIVTIATLMQNFRGGLKTDELNTEECFRVIDQIAEVNPNAFLILTGGEPLLRPDIYEIIRYAADKKFMVVLGTNGTMINRVNAEKIKEAGAHGVGISIDSMNPDKHNKFRGVEKAWEHSMEAFDILNEVGVDFLVQMSVSDMNYKEIPDVVEFTEKNRCHCIQSLFSSLYWAWARQH